MSKKQLLIIIAGLIVKNIVTILFATKPFSTGVLGSTDGDDLAAVGDVTIERGQLREELEKRYGNEVLNDLIDQEVIQQAAKKYNISVSKKELERELLLIKTKYGSYDQQYLQSKGSWENQIKNKILLEKILVQDVKVSESDIEEAYQKNKDVYKIPTTVHLSHIVVKTKKSAKKVYEELKDGASFPVLALEKSIDDISAVHGGDIGYLSKKQKAYPESYLEKAKELSKGEFSKPIKTEDGYAIIYLHERIKGKTFSYQDVKSIIERQLAIEEMNGALSAEYFWDEFDVKYVDNK